MSADLTARITAALDEAQRDAEAAVKQTHTSRRFIDGQMVEEPIRPSRWRGAAWTPEQVLDLIAAHREILEWAETMINRYEDEHRNQAWDESHAAFSGAARIMLAKLAKAHRIEVPDVR